MEAKVAHEKIKSFICFEMLKKRLEVFFFLNWCFQVDNKTTSMYQIFCLHSLVSTALLEQFQLQDKQLLMEFKHVFTWSYK
jgi:hypothetical protein